METQIRTATKPTGAAAPSCATVLPGLLQRKCACGGAPGLSGQCVECQKHSLQRSAHPTGSTDVPAPVHDVLHSSGEPLDDATRAFFELRFGHDFGHVRVHNDTKAAESAKTVNALAYTVRNHIVFGAGRYAPQIDAGRNLIAHELTHVVQQRGAVGGAALQGKLAIGRADDAAEQEADRTAEAVMRGPLPRSVPKPTISSIGTLQRSCSDGGCEDCEGGRRDFWITVFFRRRATRDTMNKLRAQIDGAKAIFANCCLDLKFDFNWTLLRGGGSLPAYEGDPTGAWHYTADEQALGEGTTFSGARGVPMLLVDDVPLSGGGVTVDPRFDTTYTGRTYFAIGINQTTTPNPNCNHIAHELWHVASGLSAHDPANGTVTSCTGAGVSSTYCNGLRAMVAPRGDFPLPRRGPGATRMA